MINIKQLQDEKLKLETARDGSQFNVDVLTLYIAAIEQKILAEEETAEGEKN